MLQVSQASCFLLTQMKGGVSQTVSLVGVSAVTQQQLHYRHKTRRCAKIWYTNSATDRPQSILTCISDLPMPWLPLQEEKCRAVLPLSSASQGSISSCRSLRTGRTNFISLTASNILLSLYHHHYSSYLCQCHCCLLPLSAF